MISLLSQFKHLLFLTALICTINAQEITVRINSGNPVLPFPQFNDYVTDSHTFRNLAGNNAVGVTHAEMEQSIRDAYQIMMNRVTVPGGKVGTKPYLKFLSNPQCSEGNGYGLLGAAAMADKETFDGLWLYIHDSTLNKVKRYSDCGETSPGYAYSQLPGWTGAGANSAADGDFDIGLALLTAYLQWGEFMGITDACGEPISYKKEAINYLKALTDTLSYAASNNTTLVNGDIGLDGYMKGGDSWNELTNWAKDISRSGFAKPPHHSSAEKQHIDYAAPSYFHAFADFLAQVDSAAYAWNIYQFRRAETSSDWLMGQMLKNEKMIPFAGWVELKDDSASFTSFSDGEDFRAAWRTVLNAMWYGSAERSWDPVSHQVSYGVPNNFELDIGKRYARFLWDSRQSPWNAPCIINVGGDKNTTYWGPDILKYQYSPIGGDVSGVVFPLNWVPGTGSPSAVVAQDFNLMAELYRKLEITWDSQSGGAERYLKSIPFYFHGWFRLMGMLTLTGNYQALSKIKPTANMKVYLDVDKTAAEVNDELEYTISYRNYGSLAAQNVVITDTLDNNLTFVECSGGGVVASCIVTWNVGTVPGFSSSAGVEPTCGTVKLKVKVTGTSKNKIANRAGIACSNGSGWISNEYPNKISSIMKRNIVDIISSSNPVTNLTGGRPGVHISFAHNTVEDSSRTMNVRFKLFHDAHEAYVNNAVYRVSYFLYDKDRKGIAGQNGVTNGWNVAPDINAGVSGVAVHHEMLDEGADVRGKWNQRIIIQFSDSMPSDTNWNTMAAPTWHLDWYRGVPSMVHRGLYAPLRVGCSITPQDNTAGGWEDDWSWDRSAVDSDSGNYWPVTNDWTNPEKQNVPVTTWHPKQCNEASHTVDNVLVEEWDGYVWRKVLGNNVMASVAAHIPVVKKTDSPVMQIKRNNIAEIQCKKDETVSLSVIDIRGRVVSTVKDALYAAGTHNIRLNMDKSGSSTYFVKLTTNDIVVVKKITLLR
jgi:uncharacterized repeat protein (TIGR01451 family)